MTWNDIFKNLIILMNIGVGAMNIYAENYAYGVVNLSLAFWLTTL